MLLLALPASRPLAQAGATRTPTPTALNVPPLSVNPTSTRARSALASPTPTATVEYPEPLLTLTAFNAMFAATFVSIPTATPGPNSITLTGKPHFVDFYATWCGPCNAMKPALNKIKKKYGDQVTFWDIDIDNFGSEPLTRKYQVSFIPYMALLDAEGKTVLFLEGQQTEAELEAGILKLLGKK
jgi:thioredoxin 1